MTICKDAAKLFTPSGVYGNDEDKISFFEEAGTWELEQISEDKNEQSPWLFTWSSQVVFAD